MDNRRIFELADDEIQIANEMIRRAMPGIYTLRQLYGTERLTIDSPTTFGPRFKATCFAGKLNAISLHPDKTGSNAIRYVIAGG